MFDENNNENQENNSMTNYYDNLDSNTTDSNNTGLPEGSDQGYSRSYYKSPYEDQNTTYNTAQSSGSSGGSGSPKKRKNGFGKKLVVVATLSILGGGLAGASFEAVQYISNNMNASQVASVDLSGIDANADESQLNSSNESTTDGIESVIGTDSTIASTDTTQLATTVTDVSSVVEAVMPSVVSITNVSTTQVQVPDFFGTYGSGDGSSQGNIYEQEQESSGSGIIIGKNDTELLIVTNNHVVADSTTLSVVFVDESVVEAKIKGTDADTDLAVIAVALEDIDSNTLNQIKIADLGDSTQLKVGEAAIAIGNALGYGQSVTTGVISAVEREVTVDNVTSNLLQTDAAINPGNSGGALLNMQGQVIGINSVKYSSTEVEGMGYSIPISTAIPIIEQLVTQETKDKVATEEKGYLGITPVDVSEEAASAYSMPSGVYVAQVADGSGAEAAGIIRGDIITKLDGSSVTSTETLQDTLQYYAAGSTVIVTVQRVQDGEYVEQDVTVTLGRKVE